MIVGLTLPLVAQGAPGDPPHPPPAPAAPAAPTVPPAPVAPTPAKPAAAAPAPVSKATPSKPVGADAANAAKPTPKPDDKPTPKGSAALPGASAPSAVAEKPLDAARKGVVLLERAGRPLALGALLRGDGRILTALSPLTHGNQIDARYADGSLVHVRITHSDRASDLALLTPEGDFSRNGLKASQEPPPDAGAKLHAFGHVGDKALALNELAIKSRGTLRGADSVELENALELVVAPKATDIGGPLLDGYGEVVAIVARACSPLDKTGCTLAPYAATASSLRHFLHAVPQRRGPNFGLDGVSFDTGMARGVRLVSVQAESRAAQAGLHGGEPGAADVIVAVDGIAVTTPEAMNDAVEHHAGAQPLKVLVLSGGQYREVTLGPSPAAESPERGPRQQRSMQSGPWPRGAHGPHGPDGH